MKTGTHSGEQSTLQSGPKRGLEEVCMLRAGYGLMMLAGVCLIGYVGYRAVLTLVATPVIPAFFKGLILVAALGVIVTLIGLIRERRREESDDPIDDGSD